MSAPAQLGLFDTIHTPTLMSTAAPDLTSYDVILVNSSAGKDSQAALDYVHGLAKRAGVAGRIIVVHADLGRVEWQGTRELAEEQARHYGCRFEVVQRRGDLLDQIWQRHHTLQQRRVDGDALVDAGMPTWGSVVHAGVDAIAAAIGPADAGLSDQVQPSVATRARKLAQKAGVEASKAPGGAVDFGELVPWPSSQSRYCTSDQKTSQVRKLITRLHREAGGGPFRVLNVLGIRADESAARAKKPTLSRDSASTKTRTVDRWLPIHAWSESQVWRTIHASGVRHHPAYGLGMSRLSCCFCVFASRRDLEISARANPTLLKEYIAIEREVGHSFRPNLALKDLTTRS